MILYTTSMTVVRESADKCKAVRNILQTHMVRYEEKDLFMSAENQKELMDRLGTSAIELPQVFADGIHIGVRLFDPCITRARIQKVLSEGSYFDNVFFPFFIS